MQTQSSKENGAYCEILDGTTTNGIPFTVKVTPLSYHIDITIKGKDYHSRAIIVNRPDGSGLQIPNILKEQAFQVPCDFESDGVRYSQILLTTEDTFFDKCRQTQDKLWHQKQCDTDPEYLPRLERRAKYEVVKEHAHIKPRGGETGIDGYIDAEYRNTETGEVTRFVSRDIYDFGCIHYPYRLKGEEKALEPELWTDEERAVRKWLVEFSPFRGIRM